MAVSRSFVKSHFQDRRDKVGRLLNDMFAIMIRDQEIIDLFDVLSQIYDTISLLLT